jgi:hypothetical protein
MGRGRTSQLAGASAQRDAMRRAIKGFVAKPCLLHKSGARSAHSDQDGRLRPAPAREAGEKLFYALIYQVFDVLRLVSRCCLALELGSRHEEALANARGSGTDEGSLGWGGLLVRD